MPSASLIPMRSVCPTSASKFYIALSTRVRTPGASVFFAPWTDMEALMRERHVPLYALESGDPLTEFDFIGFTMQYELSYTNVLNMLDLAGLPVRAEERKALTPW